MGLKMGMLCGKEIEGGYLGDRVLGLEGGEKCEVRK